MAMTIPHTVLEQLLLQDGVALPSAGGADKAIHCFSAEHEDKNASMSVNVAKGLYNCHGCGISGNAWSYLTRIRGCQPEEAMRILEKLGGTANYAEAQRRNDQARQEAASRLPRFTETIYNKARITKEVLGDRVALHDYTDEKGNILFRIGRFEAWRDGKDKPDKTFRPFTPAKSKGGGYWVVGPRNEQVPLQDRIKRYPIYRLKTIAQEIRSWDRLPDAQKQQIWLVEGEKCADLLSRLKVSSKAGQAFSPLVCALYGGSKHPIDHHDLAPLYGQRVLLLADADASGRKYMKDLGRHLVENNTECRYFLPEGKDGFDVGDVAGDGWAAVIKYIQDGGGVKSHQDVFPPDKRTKPQDETTLPQAPMGDTPYFRILGFEDATVVFQHKITHRIHKIPAGGVGSEGNLIHLAPLSYWRSLAGGNDISQKHRLVWADQMIRAAEIKGEMSTQTTRMWGLGAYRKQDGSIIYNVGQKILAEDHGSYLTVEKPLTDDFDTGEIYLPGPRIELKDDTQAHEYAADLYSAILQYRWEQLEHGQAFAGWIVTSLIGGALPFRPMLWLTALPGSGKTFLLEHVLNPIFGPLVTAWADATEASMAAQTRDTALPAYLDEFDPDVGRERKMQDILGLIRVATSGGASRSRGNAKGGFTQVRPRFSLLMASVDRPVLSEANAQRIMPIRLSTAGVKNWPAVRDALLDAVRPEKTLAIRSLIIRNTVRLVRHAREIEDELLAEGASTRDAQIRGALSAGICFLCAEDTVRIGRRAPTLLDAYRPFMTLMQAMVRSKTVDDITLADALDRGYFDENRTFMGKTGIGSPTTHQQDYQTIAARYGFRFIDEDMLLCAIDWRAMEQLLRDTIYQHIALSEYLLRMPGARKAETSSGSPRRVTFAGITKQAVALPRDELKKMGLFP